MKVVLSFGGDDGYYNPSFSQATGMFGIAHLRRHLPGLEPLAKVDGGDRLIRAFNEEIAGTPHFGVKRWFPANVPKQTN